MKSWVLYKRAYQQEDNHYPCVKSGTSKIISNIFKVFSSFPQVLLADYNVHLNNNWVIKRWIKNNELRREIPP